MRTQKPKVFISHITEDSGIAVPLAGLLRSSFLGFLDFFVSSDGASIRAGDNWSAVIESSLHSSDLMLVIITPDSLERKWIYFESGGAYFLRKRVIPVCCKGVRIEALGAPLNWLQAIRGWIPEEAGRIPQEIARTFEASCPLIEGRTIADICSGGAAALSFTAPAVNRRGAIPIFLLVDASASMSGEPINAVYRGIDLLLDKLQSIEDATPMVSIITFGSGARVLLPLTAVSESESLPHIETGGGTDLGAALHLLSQMIVNSALIPGHHYRPVIAVILDGYPTDDWRSGLDALLAVERGRKSIRIGMALGDADLNTLQEIGQERVVRIETPQDITRIMDLFSWLSSSIKQTGTAIEGSVEFPEFREGVGF